MNKLLLIDGSNLIFRAYYATENLNIKNPQGVNVNAVYGLMNMLTKIIFDEKPTHIYIALDQAKETFRHKMYDDYKGGRESAPQRLKEQFPIIHEYFKSLGLMIGDHQDFEADDLIASYAKLGKESGEFVKIISGDKDLLQLVDDNVYVLTPKIGFAKECTYSPEVFKEKYEFDINRFVEYKALVGDSSDNIIGINKLGDKTAKKLIKNSDSIDDIIKQAKSGEITGKVGENIAENEDLIRTNLKLVTLVDDVDVEYTLDELEFPGVNVKTYSTFLKEQGFMKVYNALLKEHGIAKEEVKIKYEQIDNFETSKHIKGTAYIYTQNTLDNYVLSQNLGIGFSSEMGNFYFKRENINSEFLDFLKCDSPKVFYNLKRLMVVCNVRHVGGVKDDLFLSLSLLNYENYKKAIDQNLVAYGVYSISPFEEIYKAKSNPKVPEEEIVIQDILTKTVALKEVAQKISADISKNDLNLVLDKIELPLTQVLAQMELDGVYVNQDKLGKLKSNYENEIVKYEEELKEYTDININSFNQLSDLLFNEWNLPKKGIKKTTSGYSTDVDNLNKLKVLLSSDVDKHLKEIKFIDLLLEYRKTAKLLNTYVKNIEKFILDDSKIHPINHQLLAETGRLSVMDPSIQNMPIRTKLGQQIRSLFESKDGNIMTFDYSQIELRVITHFSKDIAMLDAFNNDLDIHSDTAKRMFALDEVDDFKRSQAKAINFGIIYGMSSYGLAKQVGISNKDAEEFINKYFMLYPNIKKYIDEQISSATSSGEVRTLFGRKRSIQNIDSKNFKEKEAANRMAINTPIQGTAADIMKLALIQVNFGLEEANLKSKIIMQIHDEIVLDVVPGEEEKVKSVVIQKMENVLDLDVKLKVDYGIGKSWLDAK